MLISGYDALLLDLDGTVWHGDASIPGAVDAINAAITSEAALHTSRTTLPRRHVMLRASCSPLASKRLKRT